jgi:hypothetical protein
MDATIAAALISGGVGVVGIAGAVVTSVVGSRTTRQVTVATLAAAREDRLWEKRCAAYEESVARLLHRREKRQDGVKMYQLDEASEQQLIEFAATYEPVGLIAAKARLIPFASDAVVAASAVCEKADLEVWRLYGQWRTMAKDSKQAAAAGNLLEAADDETMLKARRAVNVALQEAEDQELALIQLMRKELHSRPETGLRPWPPA